jgi:hypothetical protein
VGANAGRVTRGIGAGMTTDESRIDELQTVGCVSPSSEMGSPRSPFFRSDREGKPINTSKAMMEFTVRIQSRDVTICAKTARQAIEAVARSHGCSPDDLRVLCATSVNQGEGKDSRP